MTATLASVAETTLADFTQQLASEEPTPGGGSVAALAAAMAASLTAMVVRLSLDRPRYAQHARLHGDALTASDSARARFLELADDDAAAYLAYLEAGRMPHGSRDEELKRAAAKRDAARRATTVPLTVVQACHAQIDLVERLAGRTNASVASDLDVAALLLESAARGAASNVVVNLPAVDDVGFSDAVLAELDQRLRQIQNATARTRECVRKGGQRKPEPP